MVKKKVIQQEKQQDNDSASSSKRGRGTKLTIEEKNAILEKIIDLRSVGTTFQQIAHAVEVHPDTVKKMWANYLKIPLDRRDFEERYKERVIWVEVLAAKAIFNFHIGRGLAKDAVAALEYSDKVLGLDKYYISRNTTATLPSGLEIDVREVQIELPEESE